MRMNKATRVMCYLMMVLVPAALIGADLQNAVLYGNGNVKVNGRSTSGTLAVRAGDGIQTAKGASATIAASGITVNLAENSDAAFTENGISIKQGRATVSSQKGMTTRFASLTITPGADKAKFQLTKLNGKEEIAALLGPVRVSDGTHSMLLESGKMMQKDEQEPAPPAPKSNKKKQGAGALSGWEIAMITAGAAGGVVGGLAAAGTFKESQKQSPDRK